jgi:hypothetical protein
MTMAYDLANPLTSKSAWEIVETEVKAAGSFSRAQADGRFNRRCSGGLPGLTSFFTRAQFDKLRELKTSYP